MTLEAVKNLLGRSSMTLTSATFGHERDPRHRQPARVMAAVPGGRSSLCCPVVDRRSRGALRRLRLRATSAWLGALLWCLLVADVTTSALLLPSGGHPIWGAAPGQAMGWARIDDRWLVTGPDGGEDTVRMPAGRLWTLGRGPRRG